MAGNRTQAARGARLEDELRNLMLDSTVGWLRHLHNLAGEAIPGGPSAGPSDRRRVGNLAVDLAEKGVEVWRGLLDVQRRYDGELLNLAGGGTFRAAAAGEELAVTSGTLRSDWSSDKANLKLRLQNRSRSWVDLVLPTAVLVERGDGGDRALLDVEASPAAPVLGPGDELEIELTLTGGPLSVTKDQQASRYHGTLRVDSRGPLRLELPMELTVKA
jgi:hypothetical protein